MFALKEQVSEMINAAREIINTHEQLKAAGGGVAIQVCYSGIRERYVYGWSVYRVGPDGKQIDTDPNAHWSDYGKKVFRGEGKSFSRAPAQRLRAGEAMGCRTGLVRR